MPTSETSVGAIASKLSTGGAGGLPRFALFIGAGASATSGLPTGAQMIGTFKAALEPLYRSQGYEKWLQALPGFSGPESEYAALFQQFEPRESGRHKYIAGLLAGASPSLGYVLLANLIARGFLNTVFTTNFDDLVYQACSQWTEERPYVFSFGNLASEIRFHGTRARVLKLHGDFLYSPLKNTTTELSTQDPNFSNALIECCRDQDLIVVGYSGNDQSILDIFARLPPSCEIYWTHRKKKKVSDRVRAVLDAREQSYVVGIDSFDQLMDDIQISCGPPYAIEQQEDDRWRRLLQMVSVAESRHTDTYLDAANEALARLLSASAVQLREARLREDIEYARGLQAHGKYQYDTAIAHLREALQHADACADNTSRAYILTALANALGDKGEYPESRTRAEEALRLARAVGDKSIEASSLTSAGLAALGTGLPREAASLLVEAAKADAQAEDQVGRAFDLGWASLALLEAGDPAEAVKMAWSAVDVAETSGQKASEGYRSIELGVAAAAWGHQETSSEAFGRAVDALETSTKDPPVTGTELCSLAVAYAALDNESAAIAALERSTDEIADPWVVKMLLRYAVQPLKTAHPALASIEGLLVKRMFPDRAS